MSKSISNDARDPFWRDFTDIPFHESVFLLSDTEDDYGIAVEREGSEIRIVATQGEFLIDGYADFSRMVFSFRKAQERLKEIRNDMMRYWRETGAAEIERKIGHAPAAVESAVKDLQGFAEKANRGLSLLQNHRFDEAARAFDEAIAAVQSGLKTTEDLCKVANYSALNFQK